MSVNNEVYETLGDRWYSAKDDPIALLRAESRARNPWVADRIFERFGNTGRVLDLGCGGGFLSNDLAKEGHSVVGLDAAPGALQVAKRYDSTQSVQYQLGDVRKLPFADGSFDAVCAMDLLEHVKPWQEVVKEAVRVLRPKGLFVFYTFNRTIWSYLFAVKGVEWLVRNTPEKLHSYSYFIRPEELRCFGRKHDLQIQVLEGLRPRFSKSFFHLLLTGEVEDDFEFVFTRSLSMAYLGTAIKLA